MAIYHWYFSHGKNEKTGVEEDTPFTKMSELKDFGAVALDDTTIQITLKDKCSYFTSLLTNTVFYPIREDYLKENAKDGDITDSNWEIMMMYLIMVHLK